MESTTTTIDCPTGQDFVGAVSVRMNVNATDQQGDALGTIVVVVVVVVVAHDDDDDDKHRSSSLLPW